MVLAKLKKIDDMNFKNGGLSDFFEALIENFKKIS